MKKHNPFQNDTFLAAATDYLYLIEHRYPQGSVLKMVGDRYRLSSVERSALYRGISDRSLAAQRQAKLAGANEIRGNTLHIDGFNVLLTLGSYLNGNLVFLSNDGIMRDASEIHGKAFRSSLLDKGILLIFSYLEKMEPGEIHFYWDSPVSNSGRLSEKVWNLMIHYGFSGQSETFRSPDHQLKKAREGLLATSDSAIIDKSQVKIIDLPCHILSFHFHKPIFKIFSQG